MERSRSEKGKRRAMFLKKNAVQSKNNKCKKDENWAGWKKTLIFRKKTKSGHGTEQIQEVHHRNTTKQKKCKNVRLYYYRH